jgi:hypothetical protein
MKKAYILGLTIEELNERDRKISDYHKHLGKALQELGCIDVIITDTSVQYKEPKKSPYQIKYKDYPIDWIKLAEEKMGYTLDSQCFKI